MKFTREGKRFLLAAGLIALAALNTGNNLIYLILSLMLSFLLLSFLLLRMNLADLAISVAVTGPVFAGQEALLSVTVQNSKRIPVYSLRIAAAGAVAPVFFRHIPAGEEAAGRLTMVFGRRGLYGFGDFMVQSGFPYILLEKSVTVPTAGGLLVYPRLLDLSDEITEPQGLQQEGQQAVPGRGDEVYALRDYRSGDDWRRIHWKASAGREGFLVREFCEYRSRSVTLLPDNGLPHDPAAFETVISAAASLAERYIARGYEVQVAAAGEAVPPGSGREHLDELFQMLALLGEDEGGMLPELPSDAFVVAIVKSRRSAFRSVAATADQVIYADSL